MLRRSVSGAVFAAMLACAVPASADYDAGQQAWDAAAALAEWRAAADAEDRRAMPALGRLYLRGVGALQDYVEAHKWFNLAASRGSMEAAAERDALAAKMTPAQVAAAQERAAARRPDDEASTAAGTEAPAERPAAPSADAGPSPPRAIREAQELPAALGYAPGPADGLWGQRTAMAYRSFLRDSGMPAAEALTPDAVPRAFNESIEAAAATDAASWNGGEM